MAHLRFVYCALTAGLSVFTLTTHGAGPCEREKVLAWDGGNNFARFGYSLGLNDDLLLVGSPRHSVAGFGAGSILLYRSSPDGWLADGKIWASDSAQSDYFGLVFDVKEGRVIAGFPRGMMISGPSPARPTSSSWPGTSGSRRSSSPPMAQ